MEQSQPDLADKINRFTSQGWRVESQGESQAVVVKGHRPNHILHLLLTVLTLGLWAIVWIIVAITSKEQRRVLKA